MSFSIRSAGPADALSVAQVHVSAWRTTYASILPEQVLQSLSVEGREEMWKGVLTSEIGAEKCVYVGEVGGRVVGFAMGGEERTADEDYTGELHAIYVLAEYQRLGLGRQLLRSVA